MSVVQSTDFDAIVVGAGFGGLRALWELRDKQGLSVQVFEAGTDVGGTWYWNRYPGARTDSEAWTYCFFFDDELKQEWHWPERFPRQHQVLEYMRHVVDRFDMRKDIQFSTRVTSATWNESADHWEITTEAGETFTSKIFVSASGLLSVVLEPPFPGLDKFKGEWYQTARWPEQEPSFKGKRVAMVGTGATGVQVIPEVAEMAGHLTVFQRTANYVVPARNHVIESHHMDAIRDKYDELQAQTSKQAFGFAFEDSTKLYSEFKDDPDEVRRILDSGWEAGSFRYLFQTFADLLVNEEGNDVAAEFVREKIRAIVKDPETAELLCPKNHPYGGKRPPMGTNYYETFNRDNVSLVDVSGNAISEITERGIKLADGTVHEVDVIIFALGFDAMTGALTQLEVTGRGGETLRERWAPGGTTYLGLAVTGFPNMFMISGPQSPFANIPVVIDNVVDWVGKAVAHMRERDIDVMEATPEATEEWCQHCQDLLDATIIAKARDEARPWYLGANVPGKVPSVLFYFGGAGPYFEKIEQVIERDFEGFAMLAKV